MQGFIIIGGGGRNGILGTPTCYSAVGMSRNEYSIGGGVGAGRSLHVTLPIAMPITFKPVEEQSTPYLYPAPSLPPAPLNCLPQSCNANHCRSIEFEVFSELQFFSWWCPLCRGVTSNLPLLIPSSLRLQSNFFTLIVKLQPQHLMVSVTLNSSHLIHVPSSTA
jgi:hypothetical protein